MSDQPVREKVRGVLVRMLGYPEGYSEDNLLSADRVWIDHHEPTLASLYNAQAKECERLREALEYIRRLEMFDYAGAKVSIAREMIDRALHDQKEGG